MGHSSMRKKYQKDFERMTKPKKPAIAKPKVVIPKGSWNTTIPKGAGG